MADQKRVSWWQGLIARLTEPRMKPVPVGKDNDGINMPIFSSGSDIDRPYHELLDDVSNSLDAWRKHPLARRIVNLISAYVVGDGIRISSKYAPLDKFINDFWLHSRNRIILRQAEWCDELTRSGELFLVLFTNPIDGMSHVRAVPASRIDKIEWKDGDYEVELRYHEKGDGLPGIEDKGTWWHSFDSEEAKDPNVPIMLHFAVNRPVGALRGEGDLNPILPWLKRYSAWLEDRVRLNAGMRSFLWIVYAPARLMQSLREKYRRPPEPGSIIIAEEGAEKWEAVTPQLHAADAAMDGRAIRWMIVAGGPGTSLLDLGEGEDANLASGTVMVDMRRRFLRRRQSYFSWMLVELTMRAYERSRGIRNANRRGITHTDFIVDAPDISSEDNQKLAAAVRDLSDSLTNMQALMGDSTTFREFSLRLFAKFAEEDLAQPLAYAIVADGETDRKRKEKLEEDQIRAEIEAKKRPPTAPTNPATPRPSPRPKAPSK